jgi:hypothetical protein
MKDNNPMSVNRFKRPANTPLEILSLLFAKIDRKVLLLQMAISRRMSTDQRSAITSAQAAIGQ